jgi:hypothetical protein
VKYVMTSVLKDIEGQDLKDPDGKVNTVYLGFVRALSADIDADGQPVKSAEKIKRIELLIKVANKKEVDLDAEEVALLARAVLVFPPVPAMRLRNVLNQKE